MQQTDTKRIKSRCDWVGKVIHWEWCNRLNFSHTDKRYILKTEFDLKNEMFKFPGTLSETDCQIPARRPGLGLIRKKKRFCHSSMPKGKNKRKQKDKQMSWSSQKTEKLWNMRMMVIQIAVFGLGKWLG